MYVLSARSATPPPVPTYDVAADPILQWVTLGVALLAFGGTIFTAWLTTRSTKDHWLREERRKAYGEYVSTARQIEKILMQLLVAKRDGSGKFSSADLTYLPKLSEHGKRIDEITSTIEIIGSQKVVQLVKDRGSVLLSTMHLVSSNRLEPVDVKHLKRNLNSLVEAIRNEIQR